MNSKLSLNYLVHLVHKLSRRMYLLAGAAVVAMMIITCLDVVLRIFRRPIPGTYEVVCYLASVAVSFAMAHTLVNKGHVAVNLVVRLLARRVQTSIEVGTTFLSFILFSLLSWQSVLYGLDLRRINEVSLTLEIPFYPFVLGVAFSAAVVGLVLLTDLLRLCIQGEQ